MRVRLSKRTAPGVRWSSPARSGDRGARSRGARNRGAGVESAASINWSTAKSATAGGGKKALIKAAKKEGTLNVIALPTNWANYGKEMSTFQQDVRHQDHQREPERHERSGDPGDQDLEGSLRRAPDVVDVGGPFASAGASQGLFAPYKVMTWKSIPKNQKATNGSYYQDYGGFISFGCNMNLLGSTPCPTTWSALKPSKYHNDVALNGSPLSANAALSAVWAAAVNNGGSAKNIAPGVDFFKALMSSRELQLDRLQRGLGDRDLVPDHDQLGLPEHGQRLGSDRRAPTGRSSTRRASRSAASTTRP